MAQDISIFTRLKRLFSNDVIIRNVGGKQLKIMDTGRIQKYGNLASNSLYDRFTRLHKPVGSSLQYNPTLNYQSMRLQLYSDYEAMDHDPIIAAALDIISDETTIRNQYGDVLNINSSDENGIDTIRDKVKSFASTSTFQPLKVVILDESDYLTINAQVETEIKRYSMFSQQDVSVYENI